MVPAFIARTHHHLLLLDDGGVCFQVSRLCEGGDATEGAMRCLGAQYVAALDASEPGFLRQEPTVGAPMLFAKVIDGEICVVRTGPLEHFEICTTADGNPPSQLHAVRTAPDEGGMPMIYATPPRVASRRDHADTPTDLRGVVTSRRRAHADDDEPTLTHSQRGQTTPHRPVLTLVKRAL
jgi:hypothetical protein